MQIQAIDHSSNKGTRVRKNIDDISFNKSLQPMDFKFDKRLIPYV